MVNEVKEIVYNIFDKDVEDQVSFVKLLYFKIKNGDMDLAEISQYKVFSAFEGDEPLEIDFPDYLSLLQEVCEYDLEKYGEDIEVISDLREMLEKHRAKEQEKQHSTSQEENASEIEEPEIEEEVQSPEQSPIQESTFQDTPKNAAKIADDPKRNNNWIKAKNLALTPDLLKKETLPQEKLLPKEINKALFPGKELKYIKEQTAEAAEAGLLDGPFDAGKLGFEQYTPTKAQEDRSIFSSVIGKVSNFVTNIFGKKPEEETAKTPDRKATDQDVAESTKDVSVEQIKANYEKNNQKPLSQNNNTRPNNNSSLAANTANKKPIVGHYTEKLAQEAQQGPSNNNNLPNNTQKSSNISARY